MSYVVQNAYEFRKARETLFSSSSAQCNSLKTYVFFGVLSHIAHINHIQLLHPENVTSISQKSMFVSLFEF